MDGIIGIEMQATQHRINVSELKEEMVRSLGPERSKKYFYYLNRLLSLKLKKAEFNQLCVRVVGRDNIPLHNQFIRSILRNACSGKAPPPAQNGHVVKGRVEAGKKETLSENYQNAPVVQTSCSPGFSNGDTITRLPESPRKSRTNRGGGDRRRALRQNGKIDSGLQKLQNSQLEDGDLDNGRENFSYQVAKCSNIVRSLDGPVSVHSKDQSVSSVREDHKDMHARGSLQAPFGVPIFSVSVGGANRSSTPSTGSECISASSCVALLDSVMLRERMEQISRTQGLEGVSMDGANLLNNGLNCYLKGIIGSCIGHVGARFGHEPEKSTAKQKNRPRLVNGMRFNHQFQMQPTSRPSDVLHQNKPCRPISMQDLRVAMELNPQQLGEDWAVLLEKICIQSFNNSDVDWSLLD